MPSVYIAGPMSGVEDYNFPAFFAAEERWQRAGWSVVNPARIDMDEGFDPENDPPESAEFYMRRDFPALLTCDAIALLPGWEKSGGATKELTVALWAGLETYDAETLERIPPPPETILEEADRLIFGPRQSDYGHPIVDFTRTGRMWGAILGIPDVHPRLVGLCMAALKISREVNKPKRDNRTDAAGYIGTVELVMEATE